MIPNYNHIRALVCQNDWSGAELGRRMGVSRAEANRLLNGERKGGNKIIEGLLMAFPKETFESLFILPKLSPIVNAIDEFVSEINEEVKK